MPSRAEEFYRAIERMPDGDRTAHVEGWVQTGPTESEFLDFKTGWGQAKDIKATWSKALSGFANTEGGVLVWGVDCRKSNQPDAMGRRLNVVSGITPLDDPLAFKQALNDVHLQATIEPVRGVEYLVVAASLSHGQGKGYLICLIPEGSHKPYRAQLADGEQYWQRVSDNFILLPHSLLRSLFYPTAHARLRVSANCLSSEAFDFSVANSGTATADDVRMTFLFDRAAFAGPGDTVNPRAPAPPRPQFSSRAHSDYLGRIMLHPGETSTGLLRLQLRAGAVDKDETLRVYVATYMRNQIPQFFKVSLVLPSLRDGEQAEGIPIEDVEFRNPV